MVKNWRWCAGMKANLNGDVVTLPDEFETVAGAEYGLSRSYPVMTDPGTIGHAIALARELWKSPVAQVAPKCGRGGALTGWVFYTNINNDFDDPAFFADTEGGAVLAAIEAAPC